MPTATNMHAPTKDQSFEWITTLTIAAAMLRVAGHRQKADSLEACVDYLIDITDLDPDAPRDRAPIDVLRITRKITRTQSNDDGSFTYTLECGHANIDHNHYDVGLYPCEQCRREIACQKLDHIENPTTEPDPDSTAPF